MIFYDCSTAPSPRRARMFIAEKGLQIETRDISIAKGEQLSPEFLKVNPRATVPVLVTDTHDTLTENLAIATYLEAAFPEPPLMGVSASEKAQVAQWNAICESQGGLPIAEALRNANPHMKDRALPGPRNVAQIPKLAERGLARIGPFFDLLEARLAGTGWVALDRLSLPDITAFVFVEFARVVKKRPDESHPALTGWLKRMRTRPSAQL